VANSTQECLLDAAEQLFVENGFAATSLRSIAAAADANLAATHYHFGSKEGLFEAVIHRRVTPINEARLAGLDELERTSGYQVEDVLEAFLAPLMSADAAHLPKLVGRIYSEPHAVSRPILEREFGEIVSRFVAAISRVLPKVPQQELLWRFHFLVGGMLQTLSVEPPIGSEEVTTSADKFAQLLHYASAGFRAPAMAVSHDKNRTRGKV
jgi:AcrR family transcriptional regulator